LLPPEKIIHFTWVETMVILFVHYGVDWIRGSELGLLDLLGGLDRSRFSPVLWCNGSMLADAARRLDVPVVTSRFEILFGWDAPRFDFARYFALVLEGSRLIRRHGVKLVHTSSGAPNQWLLPVTRTLRIPLVTHVQGVYVRRDRLSMGITQASRVVAITQAVRRTILEDGVPGSRTRVIHYGLDEARLARGDARGLRKELGIGEDAVVAASIGSLIHRKGFDLLLRSAQLLEARRPELHLLIVGDGPLRKELREQARALGLGRVHFLGERQDIGAILREACDLLVSATRSEAFGMTFIEAGACGLPVIGTAVDGVPEAIVDGVTGLLVPPEDPERLAEALERLAGDGDLRRRMGSAGRERARRDFTRERYVREFASLYDELLSGSAPRDGLLGPWWGLGTYARFLADIAQRKLPGPPGG
jgi:glycosyltransferase involved in cell wall biosynthesis